MLWHFRANLQQGSENSAAHLWQWEPEDVETAQTAHMGKLCKNIMPSSIIIAGTVKILYPLLLRKLFLWDCNHSSLQMKNHQTVRRTLEGQNEWLCAQGWPCWGTVWQDQVAGMGMRAVGSAPWRRAAFHPCPRGCSHQKMPGHASPDPDSKSQVCSNLLHPVPCLVCHAWAPCTWSLAQHGTAWHSCLTTLQHGSLTQQLLPTWHKQHYTQQ